MHPVRRPAHAAEVSSVRRISMLALLLLAACGPDMAAIDAANERAEAAASRAETAAAEAQLAADGAFKSCYRTNRILIRTERSLADTKDYIDRFGMWEELRKHPPLPDPGAPKPGTMLPDGSIAATPLEALTVSPHAYDNSPATNPRDREDDDHANTLLSCYSGLGRLPNYTGAFAGGDGVTTKDGRYAEFIFIQIDDTDPKNGAATLAEARAVAPRYIGDVPVKVVGESEWQVELLPGVYPTSANPETSK
jgi:hypothetical protein